MATEWTCQTPSPMKTSLTGSDEITTNSKGVWFVFTILLQVPGKFRFALFWYFLKKNLNASRPVAPVTQRYHVTSDTLEREFDPGKRDFSH